MKFDLKNLNDRLAHKAATLCVYVSRPPRFDFLPR